jgi:hypothetical protein
MSFYLCWIMGSFQIGLLGVYGCFIGSIFGWGLTRFIVYGYTIGWLAHWLPFRCTDWSRTIMARVESILHVVNSCQIRALQASILVSIVDSEPWISSRCRVSFCRYHTAHDASMRWPYFRNGQRTHILIHHNDVSSVGNNDSHAYWVSVYHWQPHHSLPNAREGHIIITVRSVVFIPPDMLITSRIIKMHISS